jgi:hypothetical protein
VPDFLTDAWFGQANQLLAEKPQRENDQPLALRLVVDDARKYPGEELFGLSRRSVPLAATSARAFTLVYAKAMLEFSREDIPPDFEVTLSSGSAADVFLSLDPTGPTEVFSNGMMIPVGDLEVLWLALYDVLALMDADFRASLRTATSDLPQLQLTAMRSERTNVGTSN